MALRLNVEVRIYHRQPLSSVATTSAGRAKKPWGRCWEGLGSHGRDMGVESTITILANKPLPNYCNSLFIDNIDELIEFKCFHKDYSETSEIVLASYFNTVKH